MAEEWMHDGHHIHDDAVCLRRWRVASAAMAEEG